MRLPPGRYAWALVPRSPKPNQRRSDVDPAVRRIRASGKWRIHTRQGKRERDEARHTERSRNQAWRSRSDIQNAKQPAISKNATRAKMAALIKSPLEQGADEVSSSCRSGELRNTGPPSDSTVMPNRRTGNSDVRPRQLARSGRSFLQKANTRDAVRPRDPHGAPHAARDPSTGLRDGSAVLQVSKCKRSAIGHCCVPFLDSAARRSLSLIANATAPYCVRSS